MKVESFARCDLVQCLIGGVSEAPAEESWEGNLQAVAGRHNCPRIPCDGGLGAQAQSYTG